MGTEVASALEPTSASPSALSGLQVEEIGLELELGRGLQASRETHGLPCHNTYPSSCEHFVQSAVFTLY